MDDRKPKPMRFRNSAVISAAIRAIVGNAQGPGIPTARIDPPRGGFYQPPPALVGEVSGEFVAPPPSMRNVIAERAGEKLTDLQLLGVPPGHEHEPAPKKFNIIGRCCYVREADLPRLKEALERQMAKRKPVEPGPLDDGELATPSSQEGGVPVSGGSGSEG
jgi:hypothetical protein